MAVILRVIIGMPQRPFLAPSLNAYKICYLVGASWVAFWMLLERTSVSCTIRPGAYPVLMTDAQTGVGGRSYFSVIKQSHLVIIITPP